MICSCCPRKCNKPRGDGFCRIPDGVFVSKFMLHKWEEPGICGKNGTAAVFFTGCNLRCCYCQNSAISGAENFGKPVSKRDFTEEIKKLLDAGAESIDLVSPTPYTPYLSEYLEQIRKITDKPIIYNSGGYDLPEQIEALGGFVDVFLPDFKYISSETAKKYSLAPDYPEVAKRAIEKMLCLKPRVEINDDGIITSGVVIRHLVLPGHRAESMEIADYVADNFPGAYMSIMSQYTPDFNNSPYKNLNRRVTSYEYDSVLSRAAERGIEGYSQLRSSSDKSFTPDF